MPAASTLRAAMIATALTLGLGAGDALAINTIGAPETEQDGFVYAYESSLGGTFHRSHELGTPSLAELAQIGGPPAGAMFTLDADSPGSRFEAIPEPAALLPLLVGVLGLGLVLTTRRRR